MAVYKAVAKATVAISFVAAAFAVDLVKTAAREWYAMMPALRIVVPEETALCVMSSRARPAAVMIVVQRGSYVVQVPAMTLTRRSVVWTQI